MIKSARPWKSYAIPLVLLVVFLGPLLAKLLPLLFLLIILVVLWYNFKRGFLTMNASVYKLLLPIFAVIVILVIFFKSIVIVPAGKTGVFQLFGQVNGNPLSSGLHLVNPLSQVTLMSTRTEEYTMTITQGEGRRPQSDAITALTKEGLSVDLDITVLFHLNEEKAPDVFRRVGLDFDEKIIRPEIRSAIREVIAQYDAKDIYSQRRQEAATKILESLQKNIEPRGVSVEEVLLRDVRLPVGLTASIQAKLTADQDAQRMEFVLLKEEKEAERKVIEAGGQRDAQQIINESLTDRYLQYLYINSLKDRQGTIYVPTNPQNGLPLFKNTP